MRSDFEARNGVESLDSLHARRDAIVAELAPLEARYEDWRITEASRKIVLAKCDLEARLESKDRTTDKMADSLAHASPVYEAWVNHCIGERTRMKVLQNHVANVVEQINRDNIALRNATAELGLQPRGI